jgi:carbon-monoxide dehydrogenase large subunit
VGQFGIGQSVRRVEDTRFLTGHGRYLEDIRLEGEAVAVFVRSPHAHAVIRAIDAGTAAAMPGVVGVFTGADLEADRLGGLPVIMTVRGKGGTTQVTPRHPAMPVGRARHVGDPIAVVIAESRERAEEAADAIVVDYEPLGAVVDLEAALRPGAPQIWPEAPNNLSVHWEIGDARAVEAAFAKAAHVAGIELGNNRIVVNAIETRGAIGAYEKGRLTLYTPSQGGHKLREKLTHDVFGIPEMDLRVVTPDVGGGFGMKIYLYPEQVVVLWAARRLGRPVRWIGERAEAFLSDAQAREQRTKARLALDSDGRFLALRCDTIANLGAYMSMYGAHIPTTAGHLIMPSVYRLPVLYSEVRCVFTNTVPVDAYRGAGKPETNFIVERLIDTAAREMGLRAEELRRRNFVPQSAMPFTTATKMVVDSGAFEDNLDRLMRTTDWTGFDARRKAAAARGMLRGRGVAAYMEDTVQRSDETATLEVDPEGMVTIYVGTQSNGQGHETAYAQILADRLGVGIDQVRLIQGDTDLVSAGNGTGASRSLHAGGGAIVHAAEKIVERGRRIAAHVLEAAAADVSFADGRFTITGTDRTLSFQDVAKAAHTPGRLPGTMEPGLKDRAVYQPSNQTFPNGVHLCEIEIDPETGLVALESYAVVDDFGVVLNPMIVEGQVHGGVAQGIGQALHEGCVYDAASGQILTGSLMDYQLPRAADMPSFQIAFNEVKCLTNPLGVKGCGEAGAIVAPSAVINAIVDALAPLGIWHIEMPATPERVWRAIQAARGGATP